MNEETLQSFPSGWSCARLGDTCCIVGGGTPSTTNPEFWDGDIPWITSADIHGLKDIRARKRITRKGLENSATNLLPKGNLVVVTRVGLGKIALNNSDLCFSQDSQGIIVNTAIYSPEYLLYYLSQEIQRFKYESRGTTIEGVTKSQLKEIPILIPPLPEQSRIVAKIEALFAESKTVREALEKVPILLKRFRQSVLTKVCTGQLTNREANDISAPELVSRIKSQGPKSDSSLRTGRRRTTLKTRDSTNLVGLPEGWAWVKFKDVVFAQNGRSFPSRFYTEEGVRLLRPGNLHASGRLLWTPENTRYLPRSFSDRYAEFLIRENEIIMNLTAQSLKDEFLGRVCMTDQETCCLLNQRQARIRVTEAIDVRYLFWVLKSPIFRNFVMGLESGTLIQHMFTWQLNDFLLPLAPMKEQKKVVQRIEECLSYADGVEKATEAALNRINRIDQSILSKAFRGELVPQNPNDEPASILLEHMRAASHLDKSCQERH